MTTRDKESSSSSSFSVTEDRLRALAQELVDRYTKRQPVAERHGGCGWCGGLPHSTECLVGRFEVELDRLVREGAAPPAELDLKDLADVLCCVSQIFNGWRPSEEWSQWDEDIAHRVVAVQRHLEGGGKMINTIWYGPHPCDVCGATIVKAAREQGGAELDVPDRLLRIFQRGAESGSPDVTYPMTWTPHQHRPESQRGPQSAPPSRAETPEPTP